MKVRESGMPGEKQWENFFNSEEILKIMKLDYNIIDVAEFGCGYGTFTICFKGNKWNNIRHGYRARDDKQSYRKST